MKMHFKIFLSVFLAFALILSVLGVVVYNQYHASVRKQMEVAAMDMAWAVAAMDDVKEGLVKEEINHLAGKIEALRKQTQYQYIIVMDMAGIQYAYPYTSGIGKPYKNGGQDRVLTRGEAYLLADDNELISAVRAFVPVVVDGQQVGAVLVGLLTDQIIALGQVHQRTIEASLLIAVVVGALVAFFLSMNIRTSTFGLDPIDIAFLITERDLVINSIDKGILAIDEGGDLIVYNPMASQLLDLPTGSQKHNLSQYSDRLSQRLKLALDDERSFENETFTLESGQALLLSVSLMYEPDGNQKGLVASVENLEHVRHFAEEITNYRTLVNGLRAQNHEFNKLHAIAGLLQLNEVKEAQDYIASLSRVNKGLQRLLTEHIQDSKVAGLLLSKHHSLMENHIHLTIDETSRLTHLPAYMTSDDLCTIIGNLIDNGAESILDHGDDNKTMALLIDSQEDYIDIEFYNSGPEITDEVGLKMFDRGFTTKSNGSGIGLALVVDIVKRLGGHIEWQNDKGVSWHVRLPLYQNPDH